MPDVYSSLIKLHVWVYFCEKHKQQIIDLFGLEKDYFCEREYPIEICSAIGCTEKPVCRDIKTYKLTGDEW